MKFRIKEIKGTGYFPQVKIKWFSRWKRIVTNFPLGYKLCRENEHYNPMETPVEAMFLCQKFKSWYSLKHQKPVYHSLTVEDTDFYDSVKLSSLYRAQAMIEDETCPIDLKGLTSEDKARVIIARKDCPIDLEGLNLEGKLWVMLMRKDCPIELEGLALLYKAWLMEHRKDCPLDFTGFTDEQVRRIETAREVRWGSDN